MVSIQETFSDAESFRCRQLVSEMKAEVRDSESVPNGWAGLEREMNAGASEMAKWEAVTSLIPDPE